MKKKNVVFARKEFLNLPGLNSTGNIVTHITVEEENDRGYRYDDIKLDIADCVRVVNIDFDVGSEYERENSLHKVDTLISVLQDFRVALVKECEIQAKLELKREIKKAKKIEDTEKGLESESIAEVVEKLFPEDSQRID
jgi:hypothetical protein